MTTSVDFWFDPICPWAWTTSRWVLAAAAERPLDIRWHVMSLGELNDQPDSPAEAAAFFQLARGPVRVFASVAEKHGEESLGRLYTEVGNRFHGSGGPMEASRKASHEDMLPALAVALAQTREGLAEALAVCGYPEDHLAAMDDPSWDEALRESHQNVPIGEQERALIGVPTISVDGAPGFFGPVISEFPTGAPAGELWDAFATLATSPVFFELKRVTDRPVPLQAWEG